MSKTYRHPGMKQLKDQQTRYAPKDRRLEQVERAEQLLGEIEATKQYPYDICAIGSPAIARTGGRPWYSTAAMCSTTSGCSWKTSLPRSARLWSRRRAGADRRGGRPAVRCSTRTVTRWRRQGLVARRFVMAGRTKVGFLESSLESFVTTHRDQVERGSRFRH